MSETMSGVIFHRLKYFLTPQFDLYKNIHKKFCSMPLRETRILDYGCGTGIGSLTLYDGPLTSIVGIDSEPDTINFATELFGRFVTFKTEDWVKKLPPVEEDKYDTIVCIEVIEHVDNPEDLLSIFYAVLKPGGRLIISTVNHNSQFRKNSCHVGKYCIKDYKELLEKIFIASKVAVTDYTLKGELSNDSTRTPMIGICKK